MFKAGMRNRRIEILHHTGERDAANDLVGDWTVVGRAWASIKHVSRITAIKAGADHEIVNASIRIPFRRSLFAGMRVRHGEEVYEVESVLPDEVRHQYTDLVCRKLSQREVTS